MKEKMDKQKIKKLKMKNCGNRRPKKAKYCNQANSNQKLKRPKQLSKLLMKIKRGNTKLKCFCLSIFP